MKTLEQRINDDKSLGKASKAVLLNALEKPWFTYAFNRFGASSVAHVLQNWHVSAEPFVEPGLVGLDAALERQIIQMFHNLELYANTPRHGPTRQQRRATGKAWRNSAARVAQRFAHA